MERITVIGLNWRSGGPKHIARFTIPPDDRAHKLPELAQALGARELVYLATCNRVELAFVSDNPNPQARKLVYRELTGLEAQPGEAERVLRAWAGEGAVEHVFLVTTGLDSAKVGETEITGQVRDALALGKQQGLVGPRLELLFRQALKLARETRLHTHLADGRTSLAELALDHVRTKLARDPGVVALLGVSPMTERCGQSLAQEGAELLVVNRTLARAEELCEGLGGSPRALALTEFQAEPRPIAALISATGATTTVLAEAELQRLAATCEGALPILIDLAVPPDVAPDVAEHLGFERIGMEEIIAAAEATREQHLQQAAEARELVDQAVVHFSGRLAERAVEKAARSLHERFLATASDQVERLMRAKLRDLDEEQREVLRRFVTRLAGHFAHLPASGLRELARAHGVDAVQCFFARADAELRAELERSFEQGEAFLAPDETTDETLSEETTS